MFFLNAGQNRPTGIGLIFIGLAPLGSDYTKENTVFRESRERGHRLSLSGDTHLFDLADTGSTRWPFGLILLT